MNCGFIPRTWAKSLDGRARRLMRFGHCCWWEAPSGVCGARWKWLMKRRTKAVGIRTITVIATHTHTVMDTAIRIRTATGTGALAGDRVVVTGVEDAAGAAGNGEARTAATSIFALQHGV